VPSTDQSNLATSPPPLSIDTLRVNNKAPIKMAIFGMGTSYVLFALLHFFQFVLAITVCALYGIDLQHAREQGKYTDGKWVSLVGSLL
jgi:hypothetical protein